ncbi:hypothetical protein SUGI_0014520 [Cryptomeria japonica]|nr:hypothetical protein SUGI_0014520 [Cryptomeria japonica]
MGRERTHRTSTSLQGLIYFWIPSFRSSHREATVNMGSDNILDCFHYHFVRLTAFKLRVSYEEVKQGRGRATTGKMFFQAP